MAFVIASCHFVLPINSGNQIKNISEAKLGRASITSNVNFSNLNGFVQFFDLHGAGVCCNTWVICCIRSNRDILADYFSVVSKKIATSREYWKCIMPKVGTLDFLKHFIFFKVIFYAIVKCVLFTFKRHMLLKDWHLGILACLLESHESFSTKSCGFDGRSLPFWARVFERYTTFSQISYRHGECGISLLNTNSGWFLTKS